MRVLSKIEERDPLLLTVVTQIPTMIYYTETAVSNKFQRCNVVENTTSQRKYLLVIKTAYLLNSKEC